MARVRDNLLNRTTQSEYDLANRPVRVKTAEAGQHVYTGQVAYDNVYGNLSEFTEKVGENRQEFGTKFGYDDENRPTSLTYSASGKEIGQSTTTIDKLNRTTFSAVKLGSKTFTSEYHFAAGGYGTGSVTNLVSSITQPGCNCGYGYDDNGNIASATLNGKWTGYTCDALGQLIQVNDHSDTRSGENGTTWKYTYDLGGNILKKERFAYADTTNPLETVTYTYGDANWRDKLTAVNGSTIRYDAIGNPLNDGTWTYTWQNGRQLQKMQKSGVTAEFVYNADGLRVQKTVNGVATKYTLHGKNIVHMTSGTDELHFFYDAQNRPAVVVYNGVPYAYVKSLQGDIVALLNGAGNVVVSYAYDAWGAPIGKSGSMASTLGTVQPFRYRGYVFDEEIGLYYLRSRYYSAERCRYVNADSLLRTNLITLNAYHYCRNNSISFRDAGGYEETISYEFPFELNGAAMLEYVRKWWSREQSGLNPEFNSGREKDHCTAFVSETLYAGGYPEDNEWYYDIFRIFVWAKNLNSRAWGDAKSLYDKMLSDGWPMREIETVSDLQAAIADGFINEPCIAFFSNDAEGVHHAVIVANITEDNAFYYAHTNDRNAYEPASDESSLAGVLNDSERIVIFKVTN